MDSRAQVSIEVALVAGIAILVAVSLVNLNFERLNLAREVGEGGEAKMVATLLATSINTVHANGRGFELTLSQDKLNFTELTDVDKGTGIILPIIIDNANRKVIVGRNMSRTGHTGQWNVSVSIVPNNVVREDPDGYPELTIRNNGTNVIIYADSSKVRVLP